MKFFEKVLNPIKIALDECRSLLVNINKRQLTIEMNVDEIINSIDEISEEKTEKFNIEKREMIDSVINIMDGIENFYLYTKKSGNEALINQANLLWQNAKKELNYLGVIILGEVNELVDLELMSIESVINYETINDNTVVEVLSFGYLYNKEIIRKAKVVINKKQ